MGKLLLSVLLALAAFGPTVKPPRARGACRAKPSEAVASRPSEFQRLWQADDPRANWTSRPQRRRVSAVRRPLPEPAGSASSRGTHPRISPGRREAEGEFQEALDGRPEAKLLHAGRPARDLHAVPFQMSREQRDHLRLPVCGARAVLHMTDVARARDAWMGWSRATWEATRSSSTSPTRRGHVVDPRGNFTSDS